tara:strand:- start:22416 stop:23885 length:1470 start_codon:yes stop_codon:yes gene_type:complete
MKRIISIILIILIIFGGIYIFRQFSQKTYQISNKQIKLQHENKKIDYLKRLQNFHIEEKKENYRLNKIHYHTKLYDLYYSGVPDKYDNDGNKIKGIEPNSVKVIKHLRKIIKYSPKSQIDSARLDLAKLYHFGMHKFKPQLKIAEKLYKSIILSCKNEDVHVQTEDLLERVNKDIRENHVYKWLNLKQPKKKSDIIGSYTDNTYEKLNIEQNNNFDNPTELINTDDIFDNIFDNTFQIIEILPRPQPIIEQRETINIPIIPTIPPIRRNDPQNTHNSQVLSTAINSINNLKKSTKIEKSLPTSLKEIRKFLKNMPKNDKRDDSLKSLNRIEKNTSPFTFSDMKEVNVLNLIWNRIHSDVHKDNLDTVKESLYNQLADMQEHGYSVCATGRFTRLVDTLNVIDEEVSIKPSYVINQEMMNKSSKIRENILNTYSENERKELEKGTSNKQEEYDKNLKEKIVKELKEDYVKTKILTQEKFDNQINKWINEI